MNDRKKSGRKRVLRKYNIATVNDCSSFKQWKVNDSLVGSKLMKPLSINFQVQMREFPRLYIVELNVYVYYNLLCSFRKLCTIVYYTYLEVFKLTDSTASFIT